MTFRMFLGGPRVRRATSAGVALVTVLLLPSVAMADEVDGGPVGPSEESAEESDPPAEPEPVRPAGPYPYVLAIINGGVVTNVAALSSERDYSGVWASLRDSNDAVLRVPAGSAGIGWVVLPDGSLGPKPPPTPPEALPRQPEGTPPDAAVSEWSRTGDPESNPGRAEQYPYVLAIINGGVVTNVAALSSERDYSGVWASLRASNDAVLRVPVGSAGIGWTVMADGSLAPPKPRAGMVWNGEEWRAPGTGSVQRPSDVRGWMTDRAEPVDRAAGTDRNGAEPFIDSWMYGLLIVPDDALDDAATHEQLAERSIVMLESHGETVPFLARFDGLARLLERVDAALDSAIDAHEASTGAAVPEPEQQGLRSAARRAVEPFLRLFGVGATISVRPFG
jgi:hypothetical protein